MESKLFRSNNDRMLGGVCGGLAHYFGVDSTLVRLIFAFSIVFLGISPLVYILLWIFIPSEPLGMTAPALPMQQQDPTGEWRYDPYSGQPIQRDV